MFTDRDADAFILANINGSGYDIENVYMFRYNRLTKTATLIDVPASASLFHCILKKPGSSTTYWFRFNAIRFALYNLDTLTAEPFEYNTSYVSSADTASYTHKLLEYTGNLLDSDSIHNYWRNEVSSKTRSFYMFDDSFALSIKVPISPTMLLHLRITHSDINNKFALSMGAIDLSLKLSSSALTTCMNNSIITSRGINNDNIIIIRSSPVGKGKPVTDYTKYATVTDLPENRLLNGATAVVAYTDQLKNTRTNSYVNLMFIRDKVNSVLYLGVTLDMRNDTIWSSKYFIDETTDFGTIDQIKSCLKLDDYDGFETVIIFATDAGIYRINYEYGFLYDRITEIETNGAPKDGKILPDTNRIRLFGVDGATVGKLEAYTNDPIRRVFIAKYQNAYATYHYDKDIFYVYPSTPLENEYHNDAYYGLTGILVVGSTVNALYDECTIDADINNAGYQYLVNRVIELEKRVKALEK